MKAKTLLASAFAVVGFAVAVQSTPASAQAATTAPSTITVQRGDTLSKIARKNGTTYARLYNANGHISNPNLIYPGQKIRIPAAGEQLPDRAGATAAAAVSAPKARAQAAAPKKAAAKPAARPAAKPVAKPAAARPVARQAQPASQKTYPSVAASTSVWDRLAQCESSGNWKINTGNGFYGGLQFTASTWRGFGGTQYAPYAHQATREQQIAVAQRVLAVQGWKAWPACTLKLGIRS